MADPSRRPPMEGRYLPAPEGPSADFYRLAAAGSLHLQRCDACRRWQHPPRWRCPNCGGEAFTWEPVTGAGRLFTWTVTHRATDLVWGSVAPYATVVVELDEAPGARVVGAWEGELDDLALDLPVSLDLEPAGDAFAFLWFAPARPPPAGATR